MTDRKLEGGKNKKETSPGRLELPTSRLTVGRANQLRHGDLIVAKISGDGFTSGSRNNGFVLAITESMNWTHQTQCRIYNGYGSAIIGNRPREILRTATALL